MDQERGQRAWREARERRLQVLREQRLFPPTVWLLRPAAVV